MKVDRADVEKNLPRKGFEREKEGHHIYFHHQFNGRVTGAYTYISHSKKFNVISRGILTAMRKQLMLDSNAQVLELVNCPMDENEYNKILRKKGVLP